MGIGTFLEYLALAKISVSPCTIDTTPLEYISKEESVERAICSVQDVFGKSRARNSNIDQ